MIPQAQTEAGATYAEKIDKAEARIDWQQPAATLDAHIRGLSPFPGAWCEMDGARVKILAARVVNGDAAPGTVLDDAPSIACGAGALQLLRAQRAARHNGWRGFHARCSGDAGAGFGVMRYRLTIEYDGAGFCGWQAQADGDAVQDALSDAVEKFCGARVTVYGAGRTDSGVTRGQVAHLDLEQEVRPDKLRDAMNFHLRPLPVAVTQAAYAGPISMRGFRPLRAITDIGWSAPRAFGAGCRSKLVGAARIGCRGHAGGSAGFLGQHDFTTFRASQCQAKSPIRTLDALIVRAVTDMADAGADGVIEIHASARSFLHNQVRSLVGALKYVGEGKWSKDDCAAALAACDRTACAPVAPAWLTFMSVDYPEAVLAAPAQAAK